MGPFVNGDMSRLLFRPFRSSQTYQNLKARGEGVFHVTDDVLLLARAALGPVEPAPNVFPASKINGQILKDACRFFEFRILSIDDREERTRIEAEVVHGGHLREFFGFNRAKHAVVEAAILATRTAFLPLAEIKADFKKLAAIVDKTGGDEERQAFAFLREYIRQQESGGRRQEPETGASSSVIRVRTSSRLHFGLLSLGLKEGEPDLGHEHALTRRFGGVGLMVREPGIMLEVRPATHWSAEGPLAERALAFARRFAENTDVPPHLLVIHRAAPEHMGLGTGTQLGLAVAAVLARACADTSRDVIDLARRVERGARSGLGIHGFARGGFLVDGGKGNGSSIAPLVARADFPADWRVVLIVPPWKQGLHGQAERLAFEHSLQQRGIARMREERLCRLVLLGMLPALVERDFRAFSDALFEFNFEAGVAFAPVQGGVYSQPSVKELIYWLKDQGIRGVGQSSWGPAVFAVMESEESARCLAELLRQRIAPECVLCTPPTTPAPKCGARRETC
jgi:beta-RFAP synthase